MAPISTAGCQTLDERAEGIVAGVVLVLVAMLQVIVRRHARWFFWVAYGRRREDGQATRDEFDYHLGSLRLAPIKNGRSVKSPTLRTNLKVRYRSPPLHPNKISRLHLLVYDYAGQGFSLQKPAADTGEPVSKT